jgi:hypothetical protein
MDKTLVLEEVRRGCQARKPNQQSEHQLICAQKWFGVIL